MNASGPSGVWQRVGGALGTRSADAGRAALALYALASLWLTAPANLGLGLALLAAALGAGGRGRGGVSLDAVGRATLVLALWLCVRFGLQLAGYAEPGLVKPRAGFIDWLAPLTFAPLATLVPAGARLVWLRRLWLLALAGCTLGVLGFLYGHGPAVLWSGERLGFHLSRPLGIGLYAGVFVVVLAATVRRWWRAPSAPWCWSVRLLGIAALGLHAQVLVSAQNRTTWLAFVVVAAGAASHGLYARLRAGTGLPWRRWALGVGCGLVALATVGVANRAAFEQRFGAEQDVLATVGSEGLAAAPASSITTRLRLWRFVLARWPDAPLLGHGYGGLQDVVDAQVREHSPLIPGERYDHVHNSYLQTLWTQGALGVALWALLVGLLLRDVIRAARRNAEVRALLPAVWGALGFVAVWACFDYRLSHPDMRCFAILLLLSLRLLGQAGTDAAQPPSTSA